MNHLFTRFGDEDLRHEIEKADLRYEIEKADKVIELAEHRRRRLRIYCAKWAKICQDTMQHSNWKHQQ